MTDPGQALELKFVGAKTVALLRKGGSLLLTLDNEFVLTRLLQS